MITGNVLRLAIRAMKSVSILAGVKTPDLEEFVEIWLRCNGSVTRMANKLFTDAQIAQVLEIANADRDADAYFAAINELVKRYKAALPEEVAETLPLLSESELEDLGITPDVYQETEIGCVEQPVKFGSKLWGALKEHYNLPPLTRPRKPVDPDWREAVRGKLFSRRPVPAETIEGSFSV